MALAVTHTAGSTATGTDSITVDTFASTAGSLIVVIGQFYNTSGSAAGGNVTDNQGNTWQLAGSILGGASAPGVAVYYQNAGTRAATHVVSLNGPGAAESLNAQIIEITGQDSTSSTSAFDSTTIGTASDATSPFSVTAGAAISGNQIAIVGCCIDTGNNGTWAAPTGYTNISNLPNGGTDLVSESAYKINETGTPTPASWTWGGGGITAARQIFVTFKEASGGGGSTFTDSQAGSVTLSGSGSDAFSTPTPNLRVIQSTLTWV